MKLVPKNEDLADGVSTVSLIHGNNPPIEWNVEMLDKLSSDREYDIFREINGYWASRTPEVQDAIFDVYVRIKAVMENNNAIDAMTLQLYKLVAELFKYHKLEDVKHWIDFYGGLYIPSSIHEDFTASLDSPWTRERTYLKAEYRWLVALSVAVRCMIPVWGDYISLTKNAHGTQFKEMYAFRLLSSTDIFNSEPMERLRRYTMASLPQDKPATAAIFGGVSTYDFPMWIMGLIIVRRLVAGDVRGTDPKVTLASSMHNFIQQCVRGQDARFIGIVKDKILDGSSSDNETNISRAEGYKAKEPESAGDIAALAVYAKDIDEMINRMCPTVNPRFVKLSITSVKALRTVELQQSQITLLQWIMSPILKPQAIERLPKLNLLNCMAVAQAFLWHHGHFAIAGLLTAAAVPKGSVMVVSGTARTRVTKEMDEVLSEMYPYSYRPSGKSKANKDPNVRQPSEAALAIGIIEKELSQKEWRLTLPEEWVEFLTKNRRSRGYSVPHDIKVQLAVLVIAIAKRSYHVPNVRNQIQ